MFNAMASGIFLFLLNIQNKFFVAAAYEVSALIKYLLNKIFMFNLLKENMFFVIFVFIHTKLKYNF